ncbi:hypothetical protein FACS1894111_09980 [Clostridia bacterium]|nr:hypothetical protein FACS1894111_09980 [Clostridia bacterium]
MKIKNIDNNKFFDFGRTSENYGKYRDIYPTSLYDKLLLFGAVKSGNKVLDVGSGTAVLPRNMYHSNADFTASDISEEQIAVGKKLALSSDMDKINFKVCGADDTGFENESFDTITAIQCFHYFDTNTVIPELLRILRAGGLLCKVFMDWKPYEDPILAEMEALVLKYNPNFTGNGFKEFHYNYPQWATGSFEIETIHSYDEFLPFSKEAWIGRVLTCRGVGASLPSEKIAEFEKEYLELLGKYEDTILNLKHQIHIEIYRKK